MRTIEDFAHTLTSTGHDDLIVVLQSMSAGVYYRRIKEIEGELSKVVSSINAINSKREQLSAQKALLDRLLKKLSAFTEGNETNLELTLLHLHLSNHLDKIVAKIKETRPDESLKKKHDLSQERILLDAGRKVAITLMGRVAKDKEAQDGCAK